MTPISVALCCQNSERTLEAALRSVAWADEIVVVDGGSTDATPEIARRHADRYLVEPWRGFTRQKQFAAAACRNDWVFVLDSDEECSPQLAEELRTLPESVFADNDVLLVPRRNYVLGRHVACWGPDLQSRLVHRTRCTWRDEVLHDARLPSHPSRQRTLRGWLEHKRTVAADFRDYFDGTLADTRLPLVAHDMYARGKRCRWHDLVLRPLSAFVKYYFLKGGFRDGLFGFAIAQKAAAGVQLKYATLWALQEGATIGPAAESREQPGRSEAA